MSYKNKADRAIYHREWKKSHKKHCRAYMRKWRTEHPDQQFMTDARNHARRYNAKGSFAIEEWKALLLSLDYTCPGCGKKEPEIKLTVDHIIPLKEGGTDYISNIQSLCHSCNSRKNAKMPDINGRGYVPSPDGV